MEESKDPIQAFVELYSRHIYTAPVGFRVVESWIEDKQLEVPDFIPRLTTHCRTTLLTLEREEHILRGCIQFLSVVGIKEDVELLRAIADNATVSAYVQHDARGCAQ